MRKIDLKQNLRKMAQSPFLWIILAGTVVYFRTLFYGYTFDDGQLIVNNRYYLSDWHNIFTAFTRNPYWNTNLSYYRPVLTLSFMLDFRWGGITPFFYHLSNIVFHLMGSCLLYILLLKLELGKKASACWAVIFTVHPVFSQAVAWIPGRNDSLLTLFSLASFIMQIEYSHQGKARYFFWQVFFLALAMLTKETAVLLPVLLLFHWLIIARQKVLARCSLALLGAWGLLLTVYLSVRWIIFDLQKIRLYSFHDSFTGLMSYFGKVLLPVNLSVLPINININIYYGLAVTLVVIIMVTAGGIKNRCLFWFGLIWMILFLLPTFIDITDFPHFLEHRLYLPAVGIPLFASQIKLPGAGNYLRPRVKVMICWLMILVFGTINFRHQQVFADSRNFWENAVETSPDSYFVHYMLGLVHYNQNDLNLAEVEFNRVLQIKSNSKWTYDNLAKIHERRGQISAADEDYRQAISLFPSDPVMHNNYGTFMLDQKQWSRAESEFFKARSLIDQKTKPQDVASIYYNLALMDIMNSRLEKARENLEASITQSQYDYKTLELLANIYYRLGEPYKAGEYYLKAVRHGLPPNQEVLDILRPYLPNSNIRKHERP